MEVFLLLTAVAALVGCPIAVIVLLVWVSRLIRRVSQLELDVAVNRSPAAQNWVVAPIADAAPQAPQAPAPTATEPAAVVAETIAAREPPQPPPPPPGPSRAGNFANWLRASWIYVVSAASLALAGIFLVQYGIERGLLPPVARVSLAILFGVALVLVGEWIRRQRGSAREAAAMLPSVFAGAGIVSMFAGVLAARQLYGLIDVTPALAGLVAVAALSVFLGWFYGSVLAGVGLVGATVAPMIVGGHSDTIDWLYAYYTLIAAIGLGIDTMRRWAWVSVLALVLAYLGLALVAIDAGSNAGLMFAVLAVAALAILIPCRALAPDHHGPTFVDMVIDGGEPGRPAFPTWLAAGSVLVCTTVLMVIDTRTAAESGLTFALLTVCVLGLTLWSKDAPALSDLAGLPLVGFLLRLVFEEVQFRPLVQDYFAQAIPLREAESAGPQTAAMLIVLAVAMTLATAWRSGYAPLRMAYVAAAVLAAPLTAALLEFFWHPGLVIGVYSWALQVMLLAAVMVWLAARFARRDGQDRTRAAFAALAVLSLIALALFLVLTRSALTLAFAVLVVVASILDRRFRLPQMGLFQIAAVAAIGWRQLVEPGAGWAVHDAALWEVVVAYGGSGAAMFAAQALIRDLGRPIAVGTLESAGLACFALFANVLLQRWFESAFPMADLWVVHWAVTLHTMPWLIFTLVQLYRLGFGGFLGRLRLILAALGAVATLAGLCVAVTIANPLAGDLQLFDESLVHGPIIVNSLLVAYGMPAGVIWVSLRWLPHLSGWVVRAMRAVAIGLATLWAVLAIRHFWWGPYLAMPEVKQPELYSYTVAMMLVGGALIYQALATGSANLRRGGMSVIALTIAKVFLIDVTGLTGLTRVFSFLLLGLALAGLAWLNRWAAHRQRADIT